MGPVAAPLTATERFKAMFANAVERCCVLEAALEQAQTRIAELEGQIAEKEAAPAKRKRTARSAK
jgi:hypothetical protein